MKSKYLIIHTSLLMFILSCSPNDTNNQVEEGHLENNVYKSNNIGWTIKIPYKWKVISSEQNNQTEKRGIEALENMVEGEIDVSEVKSLIGFQKDQFNIFQSSSQPFELEYEGEWEVSNAQLKKLVYQTYMSQGIQVDTSETEIVNVDGQDFHSYKFTLYGPKGDVILNQVVYCQLINGFDFAANINYNNESDKKVMLDAWLNSKFEK